MSSVSSSSSDSFPALISPPITSSTHPPPFHLSSWISSNADNLRPHRMIYSTNTEFQLMATASAASAPLHAHAGETWYYMIKGAMKLNLLSGGKFETRQIKEGETFLMPPMIPHSAIPEAGADFAADAVCLVLELRRPASSIDSLRWFCSSCDSLIREESFAASESAEILSRIANYNGNEEIRKCPSCGLVDQPMNPSNRSRNQAAIETPVINPSTHPLPLNLQSWIASNQSDFRPPVCNKLIHSFGCEFQVMIVGGPNSRTDYHINQGEEWFFMIKGDMQLNIVESGVFKSIPIKEGESFLLPSNIPHSPQRVSDSLGLVIERSRSASELDALRWYCSNTNCRAELITYTFHCNNLGAQLAKLIGDWYGESAEAIQQRTCKKCGTVETRPQRKE